MKLPNFLNLLDQKDLLRQRAIRARQVAYDARPDAPPHAAARFMQHFGAELRGKSVAVYAPIKSEMDSWPLVERLWAEGVTVLLPCVEKRAAPLTFLPYDADTPLKKGKFDILIPDIDMSLAQDPDIILVPLLAFDRHHHRIGMGGGFYDRTLSDLRKRKKITAVGYAYAGQEIDFCPVEKHDARLDYVITERALF